MGPLDETVIYDDLDIDMDKLTPEVRRIAQQLLDKADWMESQGITVESLADLIDWGEE
jgi:hypothetical protein